jgi:prophage tail gpP-like protein
MVDLPEIVVKPPPSGPGSSGSPGGIGTGGIGDVGFSGSGGAIGGVQLPPPLAKVGPDGQDEICIIRAGGREYQDWESVWVQLRWLETFDYARFTAAERREDVVPFWQNWKLGPCDEIEVMLAGKLAMSGFISERQVGYDAANHGVQLIAKGKTFWGYKSSVNTQTGAFDNQRWIDIARKVLDGYGEIKTKGKLNDLPFDRVQNNPGELIWPFLENLARPRGIIMGSDKTGAFVFVGKYTSIATKTLKEGINIKSMNFSVDIDEQFIVYKTVGQAPSSTGGTGASEMESDPIGGTGCQKSILITPSEQPVKTLGELNDRNKNEAVWREGARVKATVVVQGWTYDGSNLWEVGDTIWLDSPMCPVNQPMSIERLTFTQDRNSGSQTTLDLVLPWKLGNQLLPGMDGHNVQPEPGAPPTQAQLIENGATP